MAFGTVALIDAVWLVFLVIMISLGKFGQAPAGVGDDDEADMEVRGPDAGKGGYEDIPLLDFDKPEIHEERILEADEEYERSTRKGSIALKVVKKGSRKGSYAQLDIDDNDEDDGFENEEFRKGSIYHDEMKESGISIAMGSQTTSIQMDDNAGGRINRSISFANQPIGSNPKGNLMMGMNPITEEEVEELVIERDDLAKELMQSRRLKKTKRLHKRSLSADVCRIAENRLF